MMKRNFLVILLFAVLFVFPCYSKDMELAQRVDILEKTVESLNKENDSLNCRINDLESTLNTILLKLEGIEECLTFDAPEYPVRYDFTEKSLEDFKRDVSAIVKSMYELYGMSEEELDAGLSYLADYDRDTLVEALFEDSSAYIELIDENTIFLIDDKEPYTIEDGNLIVYGQKLGTVDNDVLTLTLDDGQITLNFNFYRTSPKRGGKITLEEY